MADMIGTDFVREVVETIILTGKVHDIDPVSLLLIAAPESGKTTIVLNPPCKAIKAYGDMTGRGLHSVLQNNPELTHIVINDLVAVLSHRQSVNRYTISQINAITEEGLTAIATPSGEQIFSAGKRGFITSLTLELARDQRRWWARVGFTSRMLPFCYQYSNEIIIQIRASIEKSKGKNGDDTKKQGHDKLFKIPEKPVRVSFSDALSKEANILALERSRTLGDDTGFRRQKQYMRMALAHAVLRNPKRAAVNDEDIAFLKKLDNFVSYTKPMQI